MKITPRRRLPKLCGADVELGNFILGMKHSMGTGYEASRALLREIEGCPPARTSTSYTLQSSSLSWKHTDTSAGRYDTGYGWQNPQDWGRRFLPGNAGCAYIDLDHLEICLPEVISAWDHVACWHAMLRVARAAHHAANRELPPGQKIQVLANTSDGLGNSYGSHLNFLITRRAWDNIFEKKIHQLLYLAAFQVSSIVVTGQGKVGSENGSPPARYQLSQRADFLVTLVGQQTTYNRPIVNSRDESLCGYGRHGKADCARLHVIFYDSTLAHVASLLKVGILQIILSMIESEQVNPNLILDDPVEAVVRFSHDPTLKARARMATGKDFTAVELQLLFLEDASRFVESGGCEGIVPRASEILALWKDTLLRLQAGCLADLAPRLDWVLKLQMLERAMEQNPRLGWDSPEIKYLDHLYSSLDESEGLYWPYEDNGLVERTVTEEKIQHFVANPPEDTRAWTRAMVLRAVSPEEIELVDWDSIRVKVEGRSYWPLYRTLVLADPLGFTKAEAEPVFRQATTIGHLVDGLEDLAAGGAPEGRLPEPQRGQLVCSQRN